MGKSNNHIAYNSPYDVHQEPTASDKQLYSFDFMNMIVDLVRRDRRKVAAPTGSESEHDDVDHSRLLPPHVRP